MTSSLSSAQSKFPLRKLPAVFAGMDRAEALAYISRMFDAAEAGVVLWDDLELIRRWLAGCSRTGSVETKQGYAREVRHFLAWRDQHHPHLALRQLDPALLQDWVDELLAEVSAGRLAARSYNRRFSAVSALYRWASEPCRSAASGIPRNPLPRRCLLATPKTTRAVGESDLDAVLGVIAAAAKAGSATAHRDYVLVKGAFLIGARVSELARLRWQDVEALEDGGQIHLFGKGSKPRTVKISAATLALFEGLGRAEPEAFLFPSCRCPGKPLSRQAIADRMRRWGAQVSVHLHPHKLRHSHASIAVQRGVNVFVLQQTLGHASTQTTSQYVALNPNDSSSLRLG